jgi:signal transduction histidine kinase
MRLARFIEEEREAIIGEAVEFARTLTVFSAADEAALRNHFPEILRDIATDMLTEQTEDESIAKSHGDAGTDPSSDATFHGKQRALAGLRIDQVIAEYRALRASVLRLWRASKPDDCGFPLDIGRFNESIDQAIAESVGSFAKELEQRRQIFLAVVGHDLRGPLQAMTMSAAAVAQKCPPDLTKYADILVESAARMTTLLDSLLDYNLVGLGGALVVDLRPVDLYVECGQEIQILRAAYPRTKITFDSSGECKGRFDVSRVREALSNLVTNAAKYGDAELPVSIGIFGTAQGVTIKVSNGVKHCISSAELELLFDPGRRGEASPTSGGRESLGLGLFITKEIVEAHGGEASVSCDGGMVTFELKLPKNNDNHGYLRSLH